MDGHVSPHRPAVALTFINKCKSKSKFTLRGDGMVTCPSIAVQEHIISITSCKYKLNLLCRVMDGHLSIHRPAHICRPNQILEVQTLSTLRGDGWAFVARTALRTFLLSSISKNIKQSLVFGHLSGLLGRGRCWIPCSQTVLA